MWQLKSFVWLKVERRRECVWNIKLFHSKTLYICSYYISYQIAQHPEHE